MLERGEKPVGGSERLTADERRLERLLLGLRVADGIPEAWVQFERAASFVERGLMTHLEGRVALTEAGLFLANEVVSALST
jgi:oxygen-independent coproporphyrinogen-3 oxidase